MMLKRHLQVITCLRNVSVQFAQEQDQKCKNATKKAHLVISILSGRDYQNLLKPQQRFLSRCLVFDGFKEVSECLTLCQNFTGFLDILLLFLCFYLSAQTRHLCLLIQDFFSSFEILNPDNKPTIFCDLYALSKEFCVPGLSSGL